MYCWINNLIMRNSSINSAFTILTIVTLYHLGHQICHFHRKILPLHHILRSHPLHHQYYPDLHTKFYLLHCQYIHFLFRCCFQMKSSCRRTFSAFPPPEELWWFRLMTKRLRLMISKILMISKTSMMWLIDVVTLGRYYLHSGDASFMRILANLTLIYLI